MEELTAERGIEIDHVPCSSDATLHSTVIDPARPPRQAPGNRWRWPPRAHQPKAITDVDPKNRLSAVFTDLTRAI